MRLGPFGVGAGGLGSPGLLNADGLNLLKINAKGQGAARRLVPLFNQSGAHNTLQLTGNDNAWSDATNASKGVISRTVAQAAFAASALCVVFCNYYCQTAFGEQYPDITNESNTTTAEGMYLSGNMCSFEHGGANRGLFTVGALDGTTRPFFDRTPRKSDLIARAIAAGDAVAIRHVVQDFRADQSVVFPLNRMANLYHNGTTMTSDFQLVVDATNQSATGTGAVGGGNQNGSCPFVLGVPVDPNQRSAISIGSSVCVGSPMTAGDGYASTAFQGAKSFIDFGLVQSGIPYLNLGSSGDAILDYIRVAARDIAYFPQRFNIRRSLIGIVAPTDIYWSFGINEMGRIYSSFNIEETVAVMVEMALSVAIIAYAVGARLWAFQEPIQCTWNAGGTNFDPTIAEATFMNNQTPVNDSLAAGYNYGGLSGMSAVRKRVFDEIATAFSKLSAIGHAGAYISDPWTGRLQKVRGDGRLVYVPQQNVALGTTVSPVDAADGATGTHPCATARYNIGQLIGAANGGPTKATAFPSSGAVLI